MMPVYVYEPVEGEVGCGFCRQTFEDEAKITAPPIEKCPECGARVRRIVVSVNVNTKYPRLNLDKARKLGFKTGTDLIRGGAMKEP